MAQQVHCNGMIMAVNFFRGFQNVVQKNSTKRLVKYFGDKGFSTPQRYGVCLKDQGSDILRRYL